MKESNITTEFKKKEELYDSFRERIVNLIEDLLTNSKIQVHQIESRTKSYDSLSKKVSKKDKYKDLKEITDIVGIRVISYLESEVDVIDKLIRKEFKIDDKNSIDKRILQTNEFGYRSLHIVASMDSSRIKLTEYKRYSGLKFEIQIRSILQHAWAEIEHDLGYKGKSTIPESARRSFNRMAALLESADIEFDRLKKELTQYEKEVPELIEKNPENVSINQASLASFSKTNPTLEKVRKYIRENCNAKFDQPDTYSDYIKAFDFFQVETIKQLQEFINDNEHHYIEFVKEFIGSSISKHLSHNLPIFWLQHFMAAKTEDLDIIDKYMSLDDHRISGRPKEYLDTYIKTKK